MEEINRTDIRAAAVPLAVWLFALVMLAVVPSAGASDKHLAGPPAGIYYSHGQANVMHQDLDGIYSVAIRSLRPVFVN